MAEVLGQQTQHAVEIIPGNKGDFEVHLDDTLLFSKQALGRFPEEDEMLALVQGA